MRCILAVDSGGTKCEAALVRDDGTALGWGLCRVPGLNGRSRDATREAVRRALSSVEAAEIRELHLACFSRELARGIFEGKEPFVVREHVAAEWEAALNLAGCDSGVVVLAGTGSFVHVAAPDGRSVHYDGFGPLLGDWGSGYRIGLMAVREAMRARWHVRRATGLREVVFGAFGVRNALEMIPVGLENPDRCVIAALANEVDRLANEGDLVAREILETAAADLAATLRDAVETMGLAETRLRMVGMGSVAKRSRIYWEHFCGLAEEVAPLLEPVLEPLPSAAGVALAILRRFPDIDERAARENLFVTAGELLERMDRRTS